jgi:hypothetical protein
MIDRYLKVLTCTIIGAMALTYVAHNFANLGAAHGFFIYVTCHQGQESYPVTLLPVPSGPLVVAAMALVFGLELAAGRPAADRHMAAVADARRDRARARILCVRRYVDDGADPLEHARRLGQRSEKAEQQAVALVWPFLLDPVSAAFKHMRPVQAGK